jgi:hypothetical protein
MTYALMLALGCKRLLFFVIAIASFGIVLVSSAKAQTTWTVTVDVTSLNKKPVYTLLPPIVNGSPACKYTTQKHPESLYVCNDDIVLFQANTAPDSSSHLMNYDLYIYQEDDMIVDNSATPVPIPIVHAKTGTAKGGKVSGKNGAHAYYVAVFDNANNRMYVDDPKIIIGTGSKLNISELLDEIEPLALQLVPMVNADPKATREDQLKAQQILSHVKALKEKLTSQ